MMKFHALVKEHAQELAELIVKENGKNITEALADGKVFFLVMFYLSILGGFIFPVLPFSFCRSILPSPSAWIFMEKKMTNFPFFRSMTYFVS